MKINLANPQTNQQKVIEVEDENRLTAYHEKRIGMEVDGEPLGEEFKGCVFRISGGNDKQGFPMKQGVLKHTRVRLLFSKGMSCYRERRKGMRKRKSVRGCIVSPDIAILNLVLVRAGSEPLAGLNDGTAMCRTAPKRASKIAKLFNLDSKQGDDVRKFVNRREIKKDDKTTGWKAPKIQRLITKRTLQRKRFRKACIVKAVEQNRVARKQYLERLHEYKVQQKEKRHAEVAKKKTGGKKSNKVKKSA